MKSIKLNNKVLDAIDMKSLLPSIAVYREYFTLPSGQEHYRLLRYLGLKVEGSITEIGTHAATSAIALAADTEFQVVTYDIVDVKLKDHSTHSNITFRITDYQTDVDYENHILDSKMIFIDAPHNGQFERDCYNWLLDKGYKGLTIWDDIHLNVEMESFWTDVTLPKQDLSQYGHGTGTGAIYFSDNINLILE